MKLMLAVLLVVLPTWPMAQDADLLAAGEKAFKKCKACHKIGEGAKKGVGPALNNIVGRNIGADPDYKYSKAMLGFAEQTWNKATLEEFLAGPAKMIPGTKMSFRGFKKPEEIAGIIELLRVNTTPAE